jgi:hypothetical protein
VRPHRRNTLFSYYVVSDLQTCPCTWLIASREKE